ncbi:MAG TPA: outer membrane beta-barrel protein [Thermoguttaceae bacterium]|nr:outer membrane beta-barrel protein [Thermoguttaceae bacterium]
MAGRPVCGSSGSADEDGTRIGEVGNYYELTAGVNYRPHANVAIRPEIRYDWFADGVAGGQLPFNRGTASEQLSGGFDVVFTF